MADAQTNDFKYVRVFLESLVPTYVEREKFIELILADIPKGTAIDNIAFDPKTNILTIKAGDVIHTTIITPTVVTSKTKSATVSGTGVKGSPIVADVNVASGENMLSVETGGVKVITATKATATIDLTGNGSDPKPLTASVKVSKAPGNLVAARSDGIAVFAAEPPPDVTSFFIDAELGNDEVNTGTRAKPFKTIKHALGILREYADEGTRTTLYLQAERPEYVFNDSSSFFNFKGLGRLVVRTYADPVYGGSSVDGGYSWWMGAEAMRPKVINKFDRNHTTKRVQKRGIAGFNTLTFMGLDVVFESNYEESTKEMYPQIFEGNRWFIPSAFGVIEFEGCYIRFMGNSNQTMQQGGSKLSLVGTVLDYSDMDSHDVAFNSIRRTIASAITLLYSSNGNNPSHSGDEKRAPYSAIGHNVPTLSKGHRTWVTPASYNLKSKVAYGFLHTWDIFSQDPTTSGEGF